MKMTEPKVIREYIVINKKGSRIHTINGEFIIQLGETDIEVLVNIKLKT